MSGFSIVDGYYTGLLVPEVRESGIPTYASSQRVLSRQEIADIINDPRRVSARQRFTASEWIRNQGSRGSCFPAGTLIRMADGSQKPIEEVRLLDRVLTAEGRIRQVIRTMVRMAGPTIKRVCIWGHRHLRCTQEHPFLTKRGYVAAEELTTDDWVAIPRFAPQTVSIIEPYSYVKQPVGVKKQKVRVGAVGKITYQIPGKSASTMHRVDLPEVLELDREFGYLIGVFLAEGSLNNRKMIFSFNANEVDTLAEKVCQVFKSRFGIEATKVVRGTRCDVKVYGVLWCEFFAAMCSTGSSEKRLHPDLTSGPKEFLEGVLEGWQDGDGLGEPNRRGGVTVSHSLAMNMFDIANALGHMPTVETLDVKINPKHKIKQRKRRYIVAWCRDGKKPERNVRRQLEEKVVWRKVAKVTEEAFSGPVYNLEVEDDHSYCAESLGVHNCNGYSCAKALERSRVLQGMPHIPLSGEGAYAQMNGGRDNGSTLANGMKVLLESGVPPESMVPHQEYLWSRISSEAKAARARFRAAECYAVDEEIELASGLALGFVGVIAVHASSNYSRLDANGVSAESNGPGNHSVGADDLRIVDNEFQFDSFNSWGIRWGHQGRNWVTWRRHLQQTIRYHQFFLIRAAGDDPQGTNPPAVKG